MNPTLPRMLPWALMLVTCVAAPQTELLSRRNVEAFRSTHPCPLTGMTTNACPGWEVALITPRCAGGNDLPLNMQWLTTAAAAAKDEAERQLCPQPVVQPRT